LVDLVIFYRNPHSRIFHDIPLFLTFILFWGCEFRWMNDCNDGEVINKWMQWMRLGFHHPLPSGDWSHGIWIDGAIRDSGIPLKIFGSMVTVNDSLILFDWSMIWLIFISGLAFIWLVDDLVDDDIGMIPLYWIRYWMNDFLL
jgi:hypothetical protein